MAAMRARLQALLLRIATWLMWLATRVGRRRLERTESNALLAAAASQAIDEADLWNGPPEAARPAGGADKGSGGAGAPVQVPDGYRRVLPRAQLSPMFGNAVLLVEETDRLFLPIFVGATEAVAFRARLDGRPAARPLTHDLLDSLLAQMGAQVVGVQIDELRGDVFYARLWVELADGELIELDARPSDAIVLAMGVGAPVLVAQEVLDEAGRKFDGTAPGAQLVGDVG